MFISIYPISRYRTPMFKRLEATIKQIPPRYVGVFIHVSLGISALFQPALQGGVFAFLSLHAPVISIQLLGVGFLILAIVGAFFPNRRIYLITGLLFVLFALVAAYGAFILHEVTYQSGILWLGVAFYNLLCFAVEGNEHG